MQKAFFLWFVSRCSLAALPLVEAIEVWGVNTATRLDKQKEGYSLER